MKRTTQAPRSGGTQASRGGHGVYYPALDTLRGFFAVAVVLFHYYLLRLPVAPGPTRAELFTRAGFGAFGVPFFFVLSAFLITGLLLEEKSRMGDIAVPEFYYRRIFRVWPVYFTALLVGMYLVTPLVDSGDRSMWLVPFLLFFANNVQASRTFGSAPMAYAALWSVSIEEQFYLVWPWVIRKSSERFLVYLGIVLIVAALAARLWRYEEYGNHHPVIWYHTSSHLDSFGCGVLACLLHRKGYGAVLKQRPGLVAATVVVSLIYVQQLTGTLLRHPELTIIGVIAYTLVPIGAGILILACAQERETLSPFWKHPVGLWFGKLSYGIYAYHGFGFVLVAKYLPPDPSNWAIQFIAMWGITLGCAVTSYYLIERPLLRFKSRFQFVPSGSD